jgi:hypothetical protein
MWQREGLVSRLAIEKKMKWSGKIVKKSTQKEQILPLNIHKFKHLDRSSLALARR